MSKANIFGVAPSKLSQYFSDIGENPAKARLVFDEIYRRGINSFSQLGFSSRVTDRLIADFELSLPEVVTVSEGDDTVKLLLKLSDGEYVESVLMRQSYGAYVCISTQVGCNMGCAFCCSGKLKKVRDLSAAEMIGQVMAVHRYSGEKIKGITVMGIGEPFDNLDQVMKLCSIATAPVGLEIGKRHITVSTCGIVPGIYEYADSEYACNLAISLHAADDGLRSTLMPVNKAYPVADVLSAAEYFSDRTNSKVTLEYIMLNGINDRPEHARQLAELIGDRRFYVNIIPYNAVEGDKFSRTSFEDIMRFYDVLKKNNIKATMRREFGSKMNAACGQLRSNYRTE